MMNEALKVALKAVEDKKALDVVVLDISGIASFADFFLICSGDSSRQIQAIADEVELKLKAGGFKTNHIEGYRSAQWVLLDFNDLVVHVFSKTARGYYDLERLWRDARKLDTRKLMRPTTRRAAPRQTVKKKSPDTL
jgi:ribosome-associated protein